MSKALESALEAVRRMSPGSAIEPAAWLELLEEIRRKIDRSKDGLKAPC